MLTRVATFMVFINVLAFIFTTSMTGPTAIFNPTRSDLRSDAEACADTTSQKTSVQEFMCAVMALQSSSRDLDITQIFGDWVRASLAFIEIFGSGSAIADFAGSQPFNSVNLIIRIVYTLVVGGAIISFISNRYL